MSDAEPPMTVKLAEIWLVMDPDKTSYYMAFNPSTVPTFPREFNQLLDAFQFEGALVPPQRDYHTGELKTDG